LSQKCEYEGDYCECSGEVKTRHAMTAYHFTGTPNSPEDPNRDFLACEAHYEAYAEHWNSMWNEYYADIAAGIRDAEYHERLSRMEAEAEARRENEIRELEARDYEFGSRNRDDDSDPWGSWR